MGQCFEKAVGGFPKGKDDGHAEGAPKDHDGDGSSAGDAHGPGSVIPGAGAEERFFEEREQDFDESAEESAAEEDLPGFSEIAQEQDDNEGTEPVDGVERGEDTAAAIDKLNGIVVGELEEDVKDDFPERAEGTAEHIEEGGFGEGKFAEGGHCKL